MMAPEIVSITIPMTFKKRCGRKVIVLPDGTQGNPAPTATIDNTMIKAIARAFRWQALIENGTYRSVEDIAKREKINSSYVGRIIKLTCLAPDIVQMILDGKQPADLTLKDLMCAFPIEWKKQKFLLIQQNRAEINLGFQGD